MLRRSTDLNGAADDSSTVVDLQQVFKQLVLSFLVLVESFCLQVDGLSHRSTEIHHSVPSVSSLQGLVAARQPEHTGEEEERLGLEIRGLMEGKKKH